MTTTRKKKPSEATSKRKVSSSRTKTNKEPKLHPAGTFDALLVELGEPKAYAARAAMYITKVKLKTEHGIVYAVFYGTLQTIMFMYRNQNLFVGWHQEIRIRHRIVQERTHLDVSLKF